MTLKVDDLFVSYSRMQVLKGITLEAPEGKISVLLGANGSGKSTLLNTISGSLRPEAGNIWYGDIRIERLTSAKILRIGIAHVPEGKGLFPEMTVMENLEMGAYSRKNKKQVMREVEDLFERFPVLDRKRKQISGSLSGGEQQTLVIARALLSKPKVLLLDEPSQGLAPVIVSEIADTITSINEEGVSIILVEHNLRLGLSIAHQVYVLENGIIAFQASATDLSGVEYAKKIYLGG